ncbi:MAG: ATP-dependent Clp protease proteolytic subunit, partial [Calditrichia bacterium]|nr:ATP-dependent Clp protease proteolytic subunit [Calditrichia bacterium]
QATDIDIHAKEILKIRERLNKILAEKTGQPLEKIAKDTDRNFFMDVKEAQTYGIIDEILTKRGKEKNKKAKE